MKDLVFRQEALADLNAIRSYYLAFGNDTLDRILDDLERSLDLVRQYPMVGPAVPDRAFRRVVSLRYGFKIAYLDEPEQIVVLGIFRFQNRDS